ncbi:helix-turn-helix domain-containing protein [Streptomyces sp. p1417]|uniref:Helix-turn-helix domain-containing protein n=1 Tax=Streptomyces typhae TaxID=2681492 RepID=A0A6L6WP42_9ACTN|nr:helix-turn-helix transcriptional regulator [Streptomyces typhae]MVO83469.1 helix-turn-helix domain-containing protein [Streptomyces typhae]
MDENAPAGHPAETPATAPQRQGLEQGHWQEQRQGHGQRQEQPETLDPRAELSEFLRTRRARLQPHDVGLPSYGRHRRVPGLRREELAQLAGVSVAYYTRLEQGNGRNVSGEVLDSIARALRLSEAEHAHLTHLAKPTAHKKKKATRAQHLRPELQHLMDAMEGVPAYLLGRRSEILGWNRMAAALFGDWGELPREERNWARLTFLNASMRELFHETWEQKASDIVSFLRMEAGCYPDDPRLSALVGELSVKSPEFRGLWATHDVKEKSHGVKRLRHPVVGELTLSFEVLRLPDDHDQSLVTYHAEPASPSAEGLALLSSWGVERPAHR